MAASERVTNVVFSGLGGQGVLKAADILAEAAFLAGYDIKKAEVHGMSQRGGFVMCDVRFGERVLSPMVPPGAADILVVLDDSQLESSRGRLKQNGVALLASSINLQALPTKRALNVAMIGQLSAHLTIDEGVWDRALKASLPEQTWEANQKAFAMGRAVATSSKA
jgi:indolepyruvate ferredoxin oxidoreductase beta subunit